MMKAKTNKTQKTNSEEEIEKRLQEEYNKRLKEELSRRMKQKEKRNKKLLMKLKDWQNEQRSNR